MALGQVAFATEAFSAARDVEPGSVEHILQAIRLHLDMDVAFVSCVTPQTVTIEYAQARGEAPFGVGDQFDPEEGYCQRIIDGRIPQLIADTAEFPEVANLACTKLMPIGSHISIPIKLQDGSVYGTFCCFSHQANPSLNLRDLQTMRAFAELAAGQIDAKLIRGGRAADLRQRIQQVIDKNAFATVYQPIFRLSDGKAVGVEALTRFCDNEQRSPQFWFAEADEVGLGLALEMAAFRSALCGLPFIPTDVYLALNVSPDAILSGEVALALADVPAGRVVIEITEHAVVEQFAELSLALEELRKKARIAIDDVGAGYSGLVRILEVRPDIIKLDMSLTRGINSDPARSALATALVVFANELGCSVVAEGIESQEEQEVLCRLGVSHGQGFYLSRPMPVPALARLLIDQG